MPDGKLNAFIGANVLLGLAMHRDSFAGERVGTSNSYSTVTARSITDSKKRALIEKVKADAEARRQRRAEKNKKNVNIR